MKLHVGLQDAKVSSGDTISVPHLPHPKNRQSSSTLRPNHVQRESAAHTKNKKGRPTDVDLIFGDVQRCPLLTDSVDVVVCDVPFGKHYH